MEKISLDTATWRDWKKVHPETEVLRKQTGFIRDYDNNPYAAIQGSNAVGFGAEFEDTRLGPKQIVYGVEFNGKAIATISTNIARNKLAALVDAARKQIRQHASNIEQHPGLNILRGFGEIPRSVIVRVLRFSVVEVSPSIKVDTGSLPIPVRTTDNTSSAFKP